MLSSLSFLFSLSSFLPPCSPYEAPFFSLPFSASHESSRRHLSVRNRSPRRSRRCPRPHWKVVRKKPSETRLSSAVASDRETILSRRRGRGHGSVALIEYCYPGDPDRYRYSYSHPLGLDATIAPVNLLAYFTLMATANRNGLLLYGDGALLKTIAGGGVVSRPFS